MAGFALDAGEHGTVTGGVTLHAGGVGGVILGRIKPGLLFFFRLDAGTQHIKCLCVLCRAPGFENFNVTHLALVRPCILLRGIGYKRKAEQHKA